MLKLIRQISIFIFAGSLFVYAQIPSVKHYSTNDGLINNDINKIYEARDGYVWFATMGGISRWDGIKFENFSQNNGLPYYQTFDIHEDENGKLYFATFGKSIITYENGRLDTIDQSDGFQTKFVWHIKQKKLGGIYFCGADESISILENGKFIQTDFNLGSTVNSIYEDENGNSLFGTSEFGIAFVKNDSVKFCDYGFDKHIWAIQQVGTDSLLIGTKKGLYLLNIKNNKAEIPKWAQIFKNEVLKIQQIQNNRIIILASEGVFIKSSKNLEKLETLNDDFSAENVFERKNGDLIFGSENGFYILNIDKLQLVKINNKKISNEIYDVIKDNKNNLIVSTDIGIEHEGYKDFKHLFNIPTYKYVNLFSQKDKIYFSSSENGVYTFFNNNFQLFNKEIGVRDNGVNCIVNIGNDSIGFGTWRGATLFNRNSIKTLKLKDGLANEYTTSILKLKDNSLYLGSHGKGITILKNGNKSYLNSENGLSDNVVNCMMERFDGAIIIGTQQAGINILKFGIIDTILTEDGLTSNNILSISEDNLGNLYAATPNGLNIIKFNDRKFFIRTLTEEDGLIGNECNIGALFIDKQNNVYIGTKNGLSKYNPNFDQLIITPPPTYINGLEIFNQPEDLQNFRQNPTLNYDQNYLKFSYVGINLSASHKTLYQYKLRGVDKDWVTSKENNVQYTSLDDGNYTFEVKARNEWGYWSEPVELAFVINPAWWETWWFYTLSILAVGSLIAFISSYRYRNLLAIEKMRSKISADLHDSIGSGLSEISILTELLKFQVPDEKHELKSGLGNVSTISRTLVESMGDIVWLVNPKKDTLKDLFKRFQLSYHEVLKHTDTDLIVENLDELENVKLPMNFRQHLYLIFKEAINNALKYSSADLLNLKIKTDGNLLTVTFSDNGKGFDLNQEKTGNGLLNMQNRAKEIGGKIEYFSEPNKGTKIIFTGKFNKQKYSFI